jgi:hypothetical protein
MHAANWNTSVTGIWKSINRGFFLLSRSWTKMPNRYNQTNVTNEKSFKNPNQRGVPRGTTNPCIRFINLKRLMRQCHTMKMCLVSY